MQARRILLFLGVALLLAAAAASLAPVPESERGGEEGSAADTEELPPGPRPEGDGAVEITIEGTAPPRTQTVDAEAHVILMVEAQEPGEVRVEGLGRIESVASGAPAVFDLFTDRTGRFDVVYTPVEGAERRLGTLVVREAAASPAGRRPDAT